MKKALYCLKLIVITASLFIINVPLFASEMDDRIESSTKESYVFKTCFRGDDIKVQSIDDTFVKSQKTTFNLAGKGFPSPAA